MASKSRRDKEVAAAAARAKAMVAVEAIFERWTLMADRTGYQGFDSRVVRTGKVLDASLGPPSSVYTGHNGGGDGNGKSFCTAPIVPGPAILASSTCSIYIDDHYSNMNGVMHGGAYGIIFDMLTTTALGPLARPGFWDYLGGVTRTLNMSYLKACPLNTTVLVHAHVYHVGRTMAMIKGWLTSEDGKVVYATCDHHKVAMATPKHHLAYRVAWDEQWEKKTEAAEATTQEIKETKNSKL